MPRHDDEPPDPRHSRSSGLSPVLVVLLAGGVLVAVLGVAAVGGLFAFRMRAAPPAVPIAEEPTDAGEARPAAVAVGRGTVPLGPPAGGEPDAPRAVALKEPVTIEGLTVRVVSVELGKARLYLDEKKDEFVEDDQVSLLVELELRVADKAKKYDYSTWREPSGSLTARDDLGNVYRSRLGLFTSQPPGWVGRKSLYDGDKIVDTMPFQPPVESAKYVDLDLPGKNASVAGTFRFRIPREAWAKGN